MAGKTKLAMAGAGDGRPQDLRAQLAAMPPLLSPAQLAGLTGAHAGSVRRGIAEGRIPADKVNGRWVIPAAFLLRNTYRFLEEADEADLRRADEAEQAAFAAEMEAAEAERARERAAAAAERARERALAERAKLDGMRGGAR